MSENVIGESLAKGRDTHRVIHSEVIHAPLSFPGRLAAVCQLTNKRSRDSDEAEAFNRYDQRLLEDLAVYCGLALQYAQAVQITEERRASIEVTQEVGVTDFPSIYGPAARFTRRSST